MLLAFLFWPLACLPTLPPLAAARRRLSLWTLAACAAVLLLASQLLLLLLDAAGALPDEADGGSALAWWLRLFGLAPALYPDASSLTVALVSCLWLDEQYALCCCFFVSSVG